MMPCIAITFMIRITRVGERELCPGEDRHRRIVVGHARSDPDAGASCELAIAVCPYLSIGLIDHP